MVPKLTMSCFLIILLSDTTIKLSYISNVVHCLLTLHNFTYHYEDCNFIKKEALAKVFFCEFWEICKNTFFYRTPAASVLSNWLRVYKLCDRSWIIYFGVKQGRKIDLFDTQYTEVMNVLTCILNVSKLIMKFFTKYGMLSSSFFLSLNISDLINHFSVAYQSD